MVKEAVRTLRKVEREARDAGPAACGWGARPEGSRLPDAGFQPLPVPGSHSSPQTRSPFGVAHGRWPWIWMTS